MGVINDFLDVLKVAQGIPPNRKLAPPRAADDVTVPDQLKEPGWISAVTRNVSQARGVYHPTDLRTAEFRYSQHPWVYQSIYVISTKAAAVPLTFFKTTTSGDEEITDHDAIRLWNRPNQYQTNFDVIEALVSYLDLTGNAYLEKVRPEGQPDGAPVELWPIRSDRVRVVPGTDKLVQGYLVNAGSEWFALREQDVIHFKYFNPANDFYGVGPLQAVSTGLVTDLYAMEYNKRFFINSARPDGILTTEQELRKENADRLREQWEEVHSGYDQWHRIAVLGKGAKYQTTGISQNEMDFIALRKMSREEILAVFGVPPILVGLLEHASYANAKEQEKIFYQVTLIPRLIKLQQQITNGYLSEWPDDNLFSEYDISDIEALKDDQLLKAQVGEVLIRSGQYSPNEVRKELHMMQPVPNANQLFIAGGMLPFAEAPEGTNKAVTAARHKTLRVSYRRKLLEVSEREAVRLLTSGNGDGDGEKATGNAAAFLRGVEKGIASSKPIGIDGNPAVSHFPADDPATQQRAAHWHAFIKSLRPHENSFIKRLQLWFAEQRDRYVERLEALDLKDIYGEPESTVFGADSKTTFDPSSIFTDFDDETKKLATLLGHILSGIVNDAGAVTTEELAVAGVGVSWNLLDPTVVAWIEQDKSIGLAKVLEETTRKRLEQIMVAGMKEGEPISALVVRMRQEFKSMSNVRAFRIARTETTTAYNFGKNEAYRQQQDIIKTREWVSSRDGLVRDSHLIDGETAVIGSTFSNGLEYPGDPSGEPEEVINCFPAGTLVQGSYIAGLRAEYIGPMFEITTRAGHKLSVTPNHPILTSQGLVPVHALREGDYVLAHSAVSERLFSPPRVVNDKQKEPAPIEDVFDALQSTGSLRSVEVSIDDLHGDAKNVVSQVDIVSIHGELLFPARQKGFQGNKEAVLIGSAVSETKESCGGSGDLGRAGFNSPSTCFPGCGTLTLDSPPIGFDTAPFQPIRVGPAAQLYAGLGEVSQQGDTSDTVIVRDLLRRYPREVLLDEIVKIREFNFSDHVYDLQSESGYNIANNICVSNCRCTVVAVLKE